MMMSLKSLPCYEDGHGDFTLQTEPDRNQLLVRFGLKLVSLSDTDSQLRKCVIRADMLSLNVTLVTPPKNQFKKLLFTSVT